MTLTKVRLECPNDWINNPIDGEINRTFFTNFVVELSEFGIPINLVRGRYGADLCPRFADKNELIFAYHGYASDISAINDRIFYLKEAPIRPLYSIEQGGYSGWSLITRRAEQFHCSIDNLSLEEARSIIESYKNKFHQTGSSKYPQHASDGWSERDYVFFPLQVQTDPVAGLSKLKAKDLIVKAAEIAEKTKTKLVLKLHPFNDSSELKKLVEHLCATNQYVIVTYENIHQLNEFARSVMSVNSGSSLEALIMGTPVWNSGTSEWWDAVNHIESLDDIEKVFSKKQPEISSFQTKLIAFLLNDYWIDGTDRPRIREKLKEIVNLAEQGTSLRSSEPSKLCLVNELLKKQSELSYLEKELWRKTETIDELTRQIDALNKQAIKIKRYDKLKRLFDIFFPPDTKRKKIARKVVSKISSILS